MKVFKFLFIALIFLNLLACHSQREETLLEIPSASANEIAVNERLLSKEEIQLERGMQWTAFFTAKVLQDFPATRSEVVNLIHAEEQTIRLEDLLGPSTLAPTFKTHFLEIILPYFDPQPKPTEEEDTPPRPIIRGQAKSEIDLNPLKPGGTNFNYNLEASLAFLASMLEENCVVLFFPNNLNFDYGFSLTSTAHPLTLAQENLGILRFGPHQIILEGTKKSIDVNVNQAYVNDGTNVIVARPTRNILHTHCYYPSLNLIHFPNFLNN